MSYYTSSEKRKLDDKTLRKVENEELQIRRKARSLTASVRLIDENNDEKKVEGMLSYFYNAPENEVTAKIMETFLNVEDINKYRDLLDEKYEYDRLDLSEKRLTHDPRCARDYFDLPTQYHFYKFMQMIGYKFNQMKSESGVRRNYSTGKNPASFFKKSKYNEYDIFNLRNLDDFLNYAFESYASLPHEENMCFSKRDIKLDLHKSPIKTFRSIKNMQADRDKKAEQDHIVFDKKVSEEFESEVFDNMIDYVVKAKGLSKDSKTVQDIIANKESKSYLGFSTKFVKEIEVQQPAKEEKVEEEYPQMDLMTYIKNKDKIEKEEQQKEEQAKFEELQKAGLIDDDNQLRMKGFEYVRPVESDTISAEFENEDFICKTVTPEILGTFEIEMRKNGYINYTEGME